MLITVSISNKSFWVQTWKMLSEYSKRSLCSSTKMARTNPDGTVSAEIDYDLVAMLMNDIANHNIKHEHQNTLTVLFSADSYEETARARA